MLRKLLSAVFILTLSWSFAQSPYSGSQFSIGPYLKTNGAGISAEYRLQTKSNTSHSLSFGLTNLKHMKEAKIRNSLMPNPLPYVYGKAFRATQLNAAFQLNRTFGSNIASPRLSLAVELGPSFAFLRPVQVYFLELDPHENPRQTIRSYNQEVHGQQEFIIGDAGWNRGFSQTTLKLGIHSAIYLQLDSERDFRTRGIKAGISLDYYPNDLQMLFENENKVFSSLFLVYQLGTVR
ncbi:MAG: hypothetical protein JXR19_06125 [Bacteroidia bacterium]